MNNKVKLIILNGTSSTGKSSIAKAMQVKMPGALMHFQQDVYWSMVPEHIETTAELFPHAKETVLDMMSAVLSHGHDVVFDMVTIGDKANAIRKRFAAYDPFLVCVKANQETVDAREKERGDRTIGMAAEQAKTIHVGVLYDFEIDTSVITSQDAADKIIAAYNARPSINL